MLRGPPVLPTSPQGANVTEGGTEVLLAISRELRESPEERAATVAPRLVFPPMPVVCRTGVVHDLASSEVQQSYSRR